jgi:hypothetical protein
MWDEVLVISIENLEVELMGIFQCSLKVNDYSYG